MVIAADTVSNLRAVVNLCVSAEANTIIPRFIIFFVVFLIPITKTGVTGQFHVTDAVFESTDANAEVIEFIGEFIGQFVDEGTLFDRGFIHVSHRFGNHFSGFVTSNVALALEVFPINPLDDAGVGQFYNRFISPAIGRYVDKGVGRESTSYANGHGYCKRC